MTPRHAQALAYTRVGIPVFPCVVNGKAPACPNGFKDRTVDELIVNSWWSRGDYNIGIVPEDAGLSVVDIDPKHGGDDTWKALACDKSPASTRTIITPSGGVHRYYYGSLPSTAGRLGPGLDTRGRLSYVLVPPSVVNGHPYVDSAAEIAELPEWISAAVERAPVELRQADADVELDTPFAIQEARAWLTRQPMAAEGNASDTFYRYAARLKDYGISPELSIELLHEFNPSYDEDDIGVRVENAHKHGQNEPGSDIPLPHETVFGEVEAPEPLVDVGFTQGSIIVGRTFAPKEWWWKDRVVAQFPQLLTGQAKVGKTTFLLNLAVHILAEKPFLGAPTRCFGDVVLLCAEDDYGSLKSNLLAIVKATGADPRLLERLHLRSVIDEPAKGGHWLARIEDSGAVLDFPFVREVLAPFLVSLHRPLLLVDPLAEFVSFNRYSDTAARSMVTTWMRGLCRVGATPLFTDHPSIASVQQGRDVGGSVQMEASFSVVSTLKAGEWNGAVIRQREMTFATKFNRYAPEGQIKFFRVAGSPAFTRDGAPGHTAEDRMKAVYRHVIERLERAEHTSKTDGGEYGPGEVAHWLALDAKDVKAAFSTLLGLRWLQYEGSAGGGKQGRTPAHFEHGPEGPKLGTLMPPQEPRSGGE